MKNMEIIDYLSEGNVVNGIKCQGKVEKAVAELNNFLNIKKYTGAIKCALQ